MSCGYRNLTVHGRSAEGLVEAPGGLGVDPLEDMPIDV
jgi:hypothetical protein